jgi:hypothetical protein
MHDAEPLRPLLRWINKNHVHKTITALQDLGHDPFALPFNFFRRNVHDQRRYFEIVLKLSYCNTCKTPRPDKEMHSESTCIECHELKEVAWQSVREQRHAQMVEKGAANRYQKRKIKQAQIDYALSRLPVPRQERPHVDPSIREAPTPTPSKYHSVEDILGSAARREPRNGDK